MWTPTTRRKRSVRAPHVEEGLVVLNFDVPREKRYKISSNSEGNPYKSLQNKCENLKGGHIQ